MASLAHNYYSPFADEYSYDGVGHVGAILVFFIHGEVVSSVRRSPLDNSSSAV